MTHYKCPVCNTKLPKGKFEKALGILRSREAHLKAHEQKKLQKLESALSSAKQAAKKARRDGVEAERQRSERILRGQSARIARLQQKLKNVAKGTTPQTDGLEFEEQLLKALQRHFAEDRFNHVGKGGDIVQHIRVGGREVGSIVYECKRTKSISGSHVQQAARAKRSRSCDFAVLNTTGTRRSFRGVDIVDGVIVVSPHCVLAIATMLRENVLSMHKAMLTKEERARVASKLLSYINSTTQKNLMGEIILRSVAMKRRLEREVQEHIRNWQVRWDDYQRIELSALRIKENFELIQANKQPKSADSLLPQQFALPLKRNS